MTDALTYDRPTGGDPFRQPGIRGSTRVLEVTEPGDEPANDTLHSLESLAINGTNLAEELDDATLAKIASFCSEGYQRDEESRAKWRARYDAAMQLVGGDKAPKTFPWPDAANFTYPILIQAAISFHSRALPAIINGKDVVKAVVDGEDKDGQKAETAQRISEHMSYQLLEEMPEWESDTDKLLFHMPIGGHGFRQWTWDKPNNRPRSEFVLAKNFVVNNEATDLQTVPLFTKLFTRYPHEIIEAMRRGEYVEYSGLQWDGDRVDQRAQQMREHYVRWDLDEDGYDEPYIVVMHDESDKILSIRANFWPSDIERERPFDPKAYEADPDAHMADRGEVMSVRRRILFGSFPFMPDPEGGFYGMGLGHLLAEPNAIINTVLNQLIDAGVLQNAGGGLMGKGARFHETEVYQVPGEWTSAPVSGDDLRKNMVSWSELSGGPSQVLFSLLGSMIEAAKELGSISDALTGQVPANTQPTTLMAMIEQGEKVFSAIYKRVYRSLTDEYGIVRDLNGAYLPEEHYYRWADSPKAVARKDYALGNCDVRPVADPTVTTAPQRMAQAQFVMGLADNPLFDAKACFERGLELVRLPDPGPLFAKEPEGPSPAEVMTLKTMELQLAEMQAKIAKLGAEGAARAAAADKTGLEAEQIRREIGAQDMQFNVAESFANDRAAADITSGMGGMAGRPDNAPGPGGLGDLRGGPQATLAVPELAGGQGGPVGPGGPEGQG